MKFEFELKNGSNSTGPNRVIAGCLNCYTPTVLGANYNQDVRSDGQHPTSQPCLPKLVGCATVRNTIMCLLRSYLKEPINISGFELWIFSQILSFSLHGISTS